mmetsp:Transcript_22085/g.50890  ORF Transcript_22085/g.50890 Transcript_22085/m.50890 type:complete len:101 (-) Transcript_22085:1672-1974(-)
MLANTTITRFGRSESMCNPSSSTLTFCICLWCILWLSNQPQILHNLQQAEVGTHDSYNPSDQQEQGSFQAISSQFETEARRNNKGNDGARCTAHQIQNIS